MTNPALLTARYARRPLLIEPMAARALLAHLSASDPRAIESGFRSPGRFEAALRRLGVGRDRPAAMEDDEVMGEPAPTRPAAYAPLWLQQQYGEPQDEGFAWCLFDGIATMEVSTAISARGEYWCGTWYHGYDTILAGMREAMADERVKAIFVRMNTPGGVVSEGLPQLAAFIRGARKAAGGKPIHFHCDMSCSAGFWINCQGDRTTGSAVSLTGSVGAVILHENQAGWLKQIGVEITAIQFGDEKTAGAWWEKLSTSARADLQAEIDQCGRNFVADVHAGKPSLTPEALIATQARVFMGQHDEADRSAVEIGFIDEVMTEEEAFAQLLEDVTPTQSASQTGISHSIAATGSRGAADPAKETPMAVRQTTNGPATARTARPGANTEAETGTETEAGTGGGDGDGMDNENPDEELDENGQPVAGGGSEGGGEAAAIAASAEAATHPSLALAAIQSGQTLAQFKANVAALAGAPKTSKLDAAMAGARRLGPDAAKPQGDAAAAGIDGRKIYGARAAAMGQRR